MIVTIQEVLELQSKRARINRVPLSEIEWYDWDEKIVIPKEVIESFEFTGLSNIDFITSNYYKKDGRYETTKESK